MGVSSVKLWRRLTGSSATGPPYRPEALGVSLPNGAKGAHTAEMVIQILQSSRSSRVRRRPIVVTVLASVVALILAAFALRVGWPA